jgi:hypothetical protein
MVEKVSREVKAMFREKGGRVEAVNVLFVNKCHP